MALWCFLLPLQYLSRELTLKLTLSEATVPRKLLRGRLGHVQVKATFLLICLVSCGTFRITPSGFYSLIEVIEHLLEMDPENCGQGKSPRACPQRPTAFVEKGRLFLQWKSFSPPYQGRTELFLLFTSLAEAVPQSSYRTYQNARLKQTARYSY